MIYQLTDREPGDIFEGTWQQMLECFVDCPERETDDLGAWAARNGWTLTARVP